MHEAELKSIVMSCYVMDYNNNNKIINANQTNIVCGEASVDTPFERFNDVSKFVPRFQNTHVDNYLGL